MRVEMLSLGMATQVIFVGMAVMVIVMIWRIVAEHQLARALLRRFAKRLFLREDWFR